MMKMILGLWVVEESEGIRFWRSGRPLKAGSEVGQPTGLARRFWGQGCVVFSNKRITSYIVGIWFDVLIEGE